MKVILSGGGTGGHIYPALSIAEEILRRNPSIEILYIGTKDGREAELVPAHHLPFKTLPVKGMPRKVGPELLPFGYSLLQSLHQAKKIIREFRPDAVIGTGGFVSFPILFQAARMGVYTLIHEQNSYPGIANQKLSKFVNDIAITYDESIRYFDEQAHITKTGNPIRDDFFHLERTNEIYESFGLDPEKKTVLVFGGSNGHEALNDAIVSMAPTFGGTNHQMIFATGPDHFSGVKDKRNPANISIHPYLFNIQDAYAIADLIITSSGAITLAEVQAAGLASILIPKSYTTENHQVKNAYAVASHGAAVVLEEKNLNADTLFQAISEILENPIRLEEMKKASRSISQENAAKQIVDIIEENLKFY